MLLEIRPRGDQHAFFDQQKGLFKKEKNDVRLFVDVDGKMYLDLNLRGDSIPVTARSIMEYEKEGNVHGLPIPYILEKERQVIEVGAGLSEFITELALQSSVKPIVIDPLPFPTADKLLRDAYRHVPNKTKENIEILRGRMKVLTDPKRIILYTMTLEMALKTNRDNLMGKADVVIDAYGPQTHFPLHTVEMEMRMLRERNLMNLWIPGRFKE